MSTASLDTMLDRAEAQCARRGAQLTALRRQVLRLVLEAEQPVGAYALLDKLKDLRGGAAPPTVYRALDFLLARVPDGHPADGLRVEPGVAETLCCLIRHSHPLAGRDGDKVQSRVIRERLMREAETKARSGEFLGLKK